ncbi:hypothetical protein KUCAC02_018651, partial [Chaenocephalus aceratus]
DPAIGDGVTRHFFATIMSKLQAGFEMKFGPWKNLQTSQAVTKGFKRDTDLASADGEERHDSPSLSKSI